MLNYMQKPKALVEAGFDGHFIIKTTRKTGGLQKPLKGTRRSPLRRVKAEICQ